MSLNPSSRVKVGLEAHLEQLLIGVWTVFKREQSPTERRERVGAKRDEQPPRDLSVDSEVSYIRFPNMTRYARRVGVGRRCLARGRGREGRRGRRGGR